MQHKSWTVEEFQSQNMPTFEICPDLRAWENTVCKALNDAMAKKKSGQSAQGYSNGGSGGAGATDGSKTDVTADAKKETWKSVGHWASHLVV